MNSCEQLFWAQKLVVDEVVPWEIRTQCNLMNAIFQDAVDTQIQIILKEKCRGCELDHPSQRRHECIMMPEDESWIMYGAEAVERVIHNQTISKHFTEAVRVMKLDSYTKVIEHFKKLVEDPETTAEFLHHLDSDFPEHQPVLGYLKYWSREH